MVLRLLARQVGSLDAQTEARLRTLSIAQLESLGEALLKFRAREDLLAWLQAQSVN